MDYEALLRKYMAHIVDQEGWDYVEYTEPRAVAFTPEEWAKLQEISASIEAPSPPPTLAGTKVFIDGQEIKARGMASAGTWMTIEAEGLPTEGEHLLGVVLPDGTGYEVDCRVSMLDELGDPLLEPRFYTLGRARRLQA